HDILSGQASLDTDNTAPYAYSCGRIYGAHRGLPSQKAYSASSDGEHGHACHSFPRSSQNLAAWACHPIGSEIEAGPRTLAYLHDCTTANQVCIALNIPHPR